MMKSIVMSCLLASALAQQSSAQVLYKSTLPDGRVVYGDKPDPNAVKVDEQRPDISKRGIGGTTPRETEALKQLERSRTQREGAEDKARSAEQALRDAEAARKAGKEPRPDEISGTAKGVRLNERYFERQKKLEEDVESAQRNVEQQRSGK